MGLTPIDTDDIAQVAELDDHPLVVAVGHVGELVYKAGRSNDPLAGTAAALETLFSTFGTFGRHQVEISFGELHRSSGCTQLNPGATVDPDAVRIALTHEEALHLQRSGGKNRSPVFYEDLHVCACLAVSADWAAYQITLQSGHLDQLFVMHRNLREAVDGLRRWEQASTKARSATMQHLERLIDVIPHVRLSNADVYNRMPRFLLDQAEQTATRLIPQLAGWFLANRTAVLDERAAHRNRPDWSGWRDADEQIVLCRNHGQYNDAVTRTAPRIRYGPATFLTTVPAPFCGGTHVVPTGPLPEGVTAQELLHVLVNVVEPDETRRAVPAAVQALSEGVPAALAALRRSYVAA